MKIFRFIPGHILFIIRVYLLGMFAFSLFRMILFLTNYSHVQSIETDRWYFIIMAFVMGIRFDTVISGYILAFPFLLLTLNSLIFPWFKTIPLRYFYWSRKHLNQIIIIYILVLYSVAFIICAADIPYFTFFFTRMTTMALTWFDNPEFVVKMILSEKSYWIFIIVLLGILVAFIIGIWAIGKKYIKSLEIPGKLYVNQNIKPDYPSPFYYYLKTSLFTILFAGLLFVGIRGRLEQKSPIRVGTAFFSPYAFPNQLGLNPVFTFLRSYLDNLKSENQRLNLTEDEKAIAYVRDAFNIKDSYLSPLARFESGIIDNKPDSIETVPPNVVIIIMESMSAEKMGRFGNPDDMTPCLDSLADRGISFDQTYTAGIHTYNGIFSTLFSHPALLSQHAMKRLPVQSYAGISQALKSCGYETVFFMTHDDQFDNTGGFLRANDFNLVISQKDYPSSQVMSTLGIPDHYLFEHSIAVLNRMYLKKKPFLAAYMTASDHGPYLIPQNIPFKPKNKDIRKAIVEYADYSINYFLKLAAKQPWFENTYFVFVADHGYATGGVFDMPLSYHHTPFIIYNPFLIGSPKSFDKMAGQIDVFPTIMGLVNQPYINNTLGINLLTQSRPFIYFSADDKIGCLDGEFFYIYRSNGPESLYRWKMNDTYNYLQANAKEANAMKKYAFSMMQASQYLIENQKVSYEVIGKKNEPGH
jgi:phosphoglycerol transferase MdoB-like AlkP superfamily enzyme